MREFPKMLYVGSTQAHKHKVAQTGDHEAELRELGFVDFIDLETEVDQVLCNAISDVLSEDLKNAFVAVEQFDAVSEELVQKELQLNVAQTERDQFKTENDDLIVQLSKVLEEKQQLEQIIDSFKTEKVTSVEPINAIDYISMTSEELRKILDEKGIKYLARDSKSELINLLKSY